MQRVTSIIVFILLCTPYLLSGSSPGGDNGLEKERVTSKRGDGEFYARVLHRDDVHDVHHL